MEENQQGISEGLQIRNIRERVLFNVIYILGRLSRKFRVWYHSRTANFPWGLIQFVNDSRHMSVVDGLNGINYNWNDAEYNLFLEQVCK